MTQPNTDSLNREFHIDILKRFNWLYSLKPKSLANSMKRLMAPDERRRIIDTGIGIRFYADPLTHLGRKIILDSRYEENTVETFRSEIKSGQVVVDVGANEGGMLSIYPLIIKVKGCISYSNPKLGRG
ncbi:hypothetical protein [Dapis sp. BLCC M172]|uniref:hypothetical protein n=1 Tax=Dapis sp. BLCC M172 TaxID=2975281 RepID=UPI003CF356D5